ncbi:MAG TPA: CoA transferase [Gaiellaceae bacterium]|nr:CoA transferase [Gaiellaceae bacterium]
MSGDVLAGIRVLDLTSSLAGPYCTQLLAALGADVVKVERPGAGDEARDWGPPFHDGSSVMFFAANAGKRSLALDLKSPGGRDAALRLAEGADVFVQSLRPGAAERLGLGPAVARARNDRLVYCSIRAYGAAGPLADEPGYDPLMQAAAGIISLTGEADRPGVRVGPSLVDLGTATWAAFGVVTALLQRERTGRGAELDVSLYETAVALVPYQLAEAAATGRAPGRHGTDFPLIAPYGVYATADGELMIAAGNDRLFRSFCEVLGLPELASDPRFASNTLRSENRAVLMPPIVERLAAEPSGHWIERLRAAGVPVTAVRDVAEVARDDQTAALGILQDVDGQVTVGPPLSFDGQRPHYRSAPPRAGEHSAEILAEAGFSEAEIAELTS